MKKYIFLLFILINTSCFSQNDELIFTFKGHFEYLRSVSFSSNNKFVVSAAEDNTIKIWDIVENREVYPYKEENDIVNCAVFSPDDKFIATASNNKNVTLWEAFGDKKISVFKGHTKKVLSVSFSPDGKFLVSASADKTLKIWDIDKKKLVKTLNGHSKIVNDATFNLSGKQILSASSDNTIKLWDVKTGKLIDTFKGHSEAVLSVKYSPNGEYFASSGRDNNIILWDANKNKPLKILSGHTNYVREVVFSPSSEYLISASNDNSLRLWEVETGKNIKSFRGHKKSISCVDFSKDGRSIVSGSNDYLVKLWDTKEYLTKEGKIRVFVENKINKWQKKRPKELEKTYKRRVNKKEKEKKIMFAMNEAILKFENIAWQSAMRDYNLDQQSFKIKIDNFQEIYVQVPLEEADDFDNNFNIGLKYLKAKMAIKDSSYVLLYVEIENPKNNKKYIYKNKEKYKLDINKIGFHFESTEKEKLKKKKEIPYIEIDIPITMKKNDNIFALIIGNEDYNSEKDTVLKDKNVDLTFAINDAKIFKEYLAKTIGVKKKNIIYIENAKENEMKDGIKNLIEFMKKNDSKYTEVIFYYSGHILPFTHPRKRFPYLMPTNISEKNIEKAINLEDIYYEISKEKSHKTTFFIDACMGINGREESLSESNYNVETKSNAIKGNIISFIACGDKQKNIYWKEKKHSLFTYFLLKKLKETSGNVNYSDLNKYLSKQVRLKASSLKSKKQNTKLMIGEKAKYSWEKWNMK